MTKHYFRLQESKYGVVLLTEPEKDLDLLADESVHRIHEFGFNMGGCSRMWTGTMHLRENEITYTIAEHADLHGYLMLFAVDGSSKEIIRDAANKLKKNFRLTELHSEREPFRDLIKKMRQPKDPTQEMKLYH